MIVDSSALPEQVVARRRSPRRSRAPASAARRCACSVVQEDIADGMLDDAQRRDGGARRRRSRRPRDRRRPGDRRGGASSARRALVDGAPRMRAASLQAASRPRAPRTACFVAPAVYRDRVASSRSEREDVRPGAARRPLSRPTSSTRSSTRSTRTGYGLTLGLHSRIDTVAALRRGARPGRQPLRQPQPDRRRRRRQPFGGEGLSGTGPKAGGPHYVAPLRDRAGDRIDTTAAGGNASLMAALEEAELAAGLRFQAELIFEIGIVAADRCGREWRPSTK